MPLLSFLFVACDCNINGTLGKICQVSGGQCPCKPNYAGRNCDVCALGYFNFPTCERKCKEFNWDHNWGTQFEFHIPSMEDLL